MDKILQQMVNMVENVDKTNKNAEDCNRIVDHLNEKTKQGNSIVETMASVEKIDKASLNLKRNYKIIKISQLRLLLLIILSPKRNCSL